MLLMTTKELTNRRGSITIRHGTKALISTLGRVLLVEEQHTNGTTFWTLPGGGVEPGESFSEGLVRELFEELRCSTTIEEPVATLWYAHLSRQDTISVYTVVECSLLSTPAPNKQEGILDYQWVSPSDLPSSTLPQVRYLLQRLGFIIR